MKFALVTVIGLAAMLFFGALPTSVPGQPNRRVAHQRRKTWLPGTWKFLASPQSTDGRKVLRKLFAVLPSKWKQIEYWVHVTKTRFDMPTGTAWGTAPVEDSHLMLPPAPAPGSSSDKPWCDAGALNREYIAVLMRHRRRVSPTAPPVCYDAVLFAGCQAFNQELELGDSLYHSPKQPKAELCGMSTELEGMRTNPRLLAQYIFTKFDQSPHHAVIQARPDLIYVSASVTKRFFVVRLNNVPTR